MSFYLCWDYIYEGAVWVYKVILFGKSILKYISSCDKNITLS